MRQFYLSKNRHGYYRVHLNDPVTGLQGTGKSTHTKDKVEATLIAGRWLKEGVPASRSGSRAFDAQQENKSGPLNLNDVVSRLSENDAKILVSMISEKFGIRDNPVPVVAVSVPAESGVAVKAEKEVEKTEIKTDGIKLGEYLLNFWDYEKSEFIKRYMAKGKKMSKKHTDNMRSLAKNYWLPYFGEDKLVQDLNEEELEDFFFYLFSERGLKGGTVNKAINCGSRAMRYLFEKHKIPVNPMAGVERYGTDELKRGIPTESEVHDLLNLEWENPVGKRAFMLSAYSGLRAGEISGLRVCDVDLNAELLHIRHSWSDVDGLKSTKNTDERDVPIDRDIALQLLNRARLNPYYSDTSYVFFSNTKPEQPCYPTYYQDSFYEAMAEIGISEEQRKERNIVFHSLRHFCATLLSQRADMKTVQAILGHRSEKMSLHYADHDSQEKLNNMRNIMQLAWKECVTA